MYQRFKNISTLKFTLLGALIFAFSACTNKAYVFTSFNEPATEGLRLLYSNDAYKWTDAGKIFLKPTIGSQKVMRDPSIAQGPDGIFHLVWTCSWRGDKGFGYAQSKDLINWSEQKFIPVMDNEPTTVNVWAPEIFYNNELKQFVIIWASTIPFRFDKGIEEENNNHRMFSITTKDFVNFSKPQLFLDPGFSVIDAVIVKRAVKDYLLVLKDNTRPNRNLKVAFSDNVLGPFTNVSDSFTAKLTEGPTVVKKANDWLIYFDAYGDKKYAALKTNDFKSFTDISSEISIPEGHKHGTILQVDKRFIKKLKNNK